MSTFEELADMISVRNHVYNLVNGIIPMSSLEVRAASKFYNEIDKKIIGEILEGKVGKKNVIKRTKRTKKPTKKEEKEKEEQELQIKEEKSEPTIEVKKEQKSAEELLESFGPSSTFKRVDQ